MIKPIEHTLPLPRSEYEKRIERCIEAAIERGLDALVIFSETLLKPENIRYLANYYEIFPVVPFSVPSIRGGGGYSVLVLPVDSEPVLVTSSKGFNKDLVVIDNVRSNLNLLYELTSVLQEKRLANATLGLIGADVIPYIHFKYLEKDHPSAVFRYCDDILENMRMVKSNNELSLIRKTAEIAEKAINAAEDIIAPDKTEVDLALESLRVYFEMGAEHNTSWLNVVSGPETAFGLRHPRVTYRKLKNNDFVVLDYCPNCRGYYADVARTITVGRPTNEQKEMYEQTLQNHQEVIGKIEVGVSAEEIAEYTVSRLGELKFAGMGIGLRLIERPLLVPGDKTKLKEGTVLTISTMIYKRGFGGPTIEDMVVVTDKGAELITKNLGYRLSHS